MFATFDLADNIIGFILEGPYDELAVEKLEAKLIEKLNNFEKINLYVEDTSHADVSLRAILKSVPFRLKTAKRYGRVAVVTDRTWLQVVSNVERLFVDAEIRIFEGERRLEALQWVSH